ncbi:unnamed protein product [Anisakis simplex]|uniref:Mannose-P-dolichol utilization defect 1 protein homolog n=1 Tax=Anisakis simplex TaxID=6269 RepID=A0A0M3JZL9_ANISI|nr:unnamed protein product [Anisakis simplex]
MTTEIRCKLDSLMHVLFPKNCFEEMVIKFNVFHPECASLVLSRMLGTGITVASLMLFIPQIIKIHMARSGAGISLSAQLLGLLSCFATAAYSYTNNFWGDTLFVAIQMVIIVMQILYFSSLSAYAFAFFAFCWAATFAVIGDYIPFAVLYALQAITIPLVVASKFLQILSSYKEGSTGQLSLISVALQFCGCLARVFTSVKETGDSLVIVTYVVSSIMNALPRLVYVRVVDYWKNVANDYKTVLVDLFEEAKQKPLKSTVFGLAFGVFAYAYKTNPSERDMLNALTERRQQMILIPNSIHNRATDREIASRTLYLDQHRLEHIDCFFFSLAVRRPHDRFVQLYLNQDVNLQDSWWKELWKNTIDVGAFGRWYSLNRAFQNYDINDEEFNENDQIQVENS